jgi:hypothetical protein
MKPDLNIRRKSLKRLAQETGLSEFSARRATQLLKLRPYTATELHALQPRDPLAGFIFVVGFYILPSKVRSICN